MVRLLCIGLILLGSVASANATTLSTAAAALSPGGWSADLASSTIGFAGGSILRPPSTGSGLEFQDRALWNPINNTAMIFGHAHPNCSPCPNPEGRVFVKYTDSTDTWSNIGSPTFPPDDAGHNYHHDTVYTPNGDMYHRDYNSNNFRKFSHATQTWSSCTTRPGSWQVAGALTYFPDRNSIVMYDGDWGVAELSLASGNCTGSWVDRAGTIAGPGGTSGQQITGISAYHNQAVYSSLCQCIFFVGQSSTTMWKMNSDATFTQVANTPLIPGIPQNPGTPAGAVFTVDPVGGHVLMWHSNNAATTMYDYNPTTNAWSTISRSNSMFPGPEGGVTETVAIPISTYGVIMFVSAGSSSGGQIRLYKHAAGTPDTTAPTAPSGLTATPTSATQINLAWTASTDNIAVTGYNLERCAGAGCSTFLEVATPVTNSANDTGLTASTLYRYRVRAHDGSNNLSSYSSIAQATTSAASGGGGADFATRCKAAGVLRCFGFDSSADLGPNPGGENYGSNYGTYIGSGTTGIGLDTSVKSDGASSLHISLAPGETGNRHGEWFTNFSTDLSVLFGSNSEFYVQWRQRFDSNFIHPGTANWKQTNISVGDLPGCTTSSATNCRGSCQDIEQVQQNNQNRGLMGGYNGCPGSVNQVGAFEESYAGTDFKLQNLMPSPFCLYSQGWYEGNPKTGGITCKIYQPNQWMTFMVRVARGSCASQGAGTVWQNSYTEYWIGYEGEALQKVLSWGPYNAPAGTSGCDGERYGKLWLTAYTTADQFNNGGNTWFDEVIISRNIIADPGSTGPSTPSGVAISRRRSM